MKKLPVLMSFILGMALVLSPLLALADPGTIEFCESFTDKFEPTKPGDQFHGPSISWLATSQEAFGKPSIVFSLYKNTDDSQTLILRREIEVNPAWTVIGLRNMAFEQPGKYTLILSQADGKEISSGTVTILEATDDKPAEPEEKMGGTMESLFNKYAPKNK